MRYTARVVTGRGEGKKLGFPTLNLALPEGFEAEYGVYAGFLEIPGRGRLQAAFHYGPVPTFGVATASLEAHVIDADIPEPPQELAFELVERLREIRKFEGPQALEALKTQIAADVAAAREVLRKV